jgi:hypothetical protein
MVVTMWAYMNHGAHYWAAFRGTARGWVRVAYKADCCARGPRRGGAGIAIKRAGSRIVIEQPVYRPSDGACCPTGGTKTGRWGWRNGRLILVGSSRGG